ncbi:MAG TPA: hypothetical protein VFE25_13085 [Opitutaceae bacterium]|jgi:hypothetical protein|nr:hypothetical protein [Opitutaceae bacterium]
MMADPQESTAPTFAAWPAPVALAALAAQPRRFTLDGDDALEAHLSRACEQVVSGIRGLVPGRSLEAVILGGGYGRGEGGVLACDGGDQPYNDLEFYVAIRGLRHLNEFLYHRRLEVLAEILTPIVGVEVEFKVTSLHELSAKPASMFSYDLALGHRVAWARDPEGIPALLERHGDAGAIPLSEASRLLMNRSSGLLFAREKLDQAELTPADADFVKRNIAKAQLACGDAVLVAHGQYHWSCRRRHRRLEGLAGYAHDPFYKAVLLNHAIGVQFKLRPERQEQTRADMETSWTEVSRLTRACWLWTESRRLGRAFWTVRDYVGSSCPKGPKSSPLSNVVLNARAERRVRWSRRFAAHPRERVFHTLSLLLWAPDEIPDEERHELLENEIGRRPRSREGWIEAYRTLWVHAR